ncbi:MAG: glycosyl hydrolase, partial [Saprospiraceae bacterium]|nr:glycosyl hydrolase [Saprospiraceae bacterium]
TREAGRGVEGVFMLGNYNSGEVMPGTYTVRLSDGTQQMETTAIVLGDPRIEASLEDYAAQEALLKQLERTFREIHTSVNEMRALKDQILAIIKPLKDKPDMKELVEQGEAISKNIEIWEQALIQPKQQTFQDVINFPNRLNAEIASLIGRVSDADPKLTQGTKARMEDVQKEWTASQQAMQEIVNEKIPAFNKLYQSKGIAPILLPGKA